MACRGPWHYGIVPFHLGKHKPVAPPKRAAFGLKLRLQVAALGALAVAIGMFQISRAVLFVIDLHGMEAYSAALVATGAVLLLFAVIPAGWLEKTADWLMSNRRRTKVL